MSKKNKNISYKKPHIVNFVDFICQEYKLDPQELKARLIHQFPELKKKEECANCGASMAQYVYTLDSLDALLVFGMGKIIFERVKKGMTFTDANKVHLQTSLNQYYSVPSRSTQCSKLGLITKVLRKDGSHDQKAGWLLTKRGFELLAGKPVPKYVQVFRNEIIERFEDTITFGDALQSGKRGMERAELENYKGFNFKELENWAIAGFSQGRLI